MPTSVTRDVVMNLKLIADKGNSAVAAAVASAGRDFATSVEKTVKASRSDVAVRKEVAVVQRQSLNAEKEIEKARAAQISTAKRIGQEIAKAQQDELSRQAKIQEAVDKITRDKQRQAELGKKLGISEEGAKQLDVLRGIGATYAQQGTALRAIRLADQKKTHAAMEQADRIAMVRREQLEQRSFATSQSAAMALGRAARGGLQIAKISVMAGAFSDSDESLEKLVRRLAQAEVVFQGLRGGLDVVIGLRQGFVLWERAARATATANALLAASNLQVAATGAAASIAGGGGIGGGVAKGAAGSAAAGGVTKTVAAVAGAGIGGQQVVTGGLAALGGSIKAAAMTAGTFAAKFIALPLLAAEGIQGLTRFGLAIIRGQGAAEATAKTFSRAEGAGESIVSAIFSWREAVASAEASTEKLAKAEESLQRQRAIRAKAEARTERAGAFALEQQNRTATSREAIIKLTIGNELDEQARVIKQADALHLMALAEAEQMEGRLMDAKDRRLAGQGKAVGRDLLLAELAAEKQLEAAVQRVADSEMQKVEALRQQVTISKQTIEQAKEQARHSADALKSEQQKFDSQLAAFGKLSEGEREYAKQIAGRIRQGQEVSSFEAEFFKKHGLGGDLAERAEVKAGRAAGGEEFLTTVGSREQLTEAERRAAEDRGKIAEEQRKATEAQERLTTETKTAALPQQRLERTRARQAKLGESLAGEVGLSEAEQETAIRRGAGAPIQRLSEDARAAIAEETELQIKAFQGLIQEMLEGQKEIRGFIEQQMDAIALNR